MAFAPTTTYFNSGDGSIIGSFREKEFNNFFEFSQNNTGTMPEYPHLVWVSSNPINDSGFRFAIVKKTVAYVAINEDEEGNPTIDTWKIKERNLYKER